MKIKKLGMWKYPNDILIKIFGQRINIFNI